MFSEVQRSRVFFPMRPRSSVPPVMPTHPRTLPSPRESDLPFSLVKCFFVAPRTAVVFRPCPSLLDVPYRRPPFTSPARPTVVSSLAPQTPRTNWASFTNILSRNEAQQQREHILGSRDRIVLIALRDDSTFQTHEASFDHAQTSRRWPRRRQQARSLLQICQGRNFADSSLVHHARWFQSADHRRRPRAHGSANRGRIWKCTGHGGMSPSLSFSLNRGCARSPSLVFHQ